MYEDGRKRRLEPPYSEVDSKKFAAQPRIVKYKY